MNKEKMVEIVKPFEFSLKINNYIICQRYFTIKNYNNDCRESLEVKEMFDEIMGTNQQLNLGIIPESIKYKCIDDAYKPYNSQNSYEVKRKDIFSLEISKNNVNKLRNSDGHFDIDDLQKEVLFTGSFDGNLFHPNVRYDVDIRGVIPDIIRTLSKYMSFKKYTPMFGDVKLIRLNKRSNMDLDKLNTY